MSTDQRTHQGGKANPRPQPARRTAEAPEHRAPEPVSPLTLLQCARHDPRRLSAGEVRQLQRMVGNQGVSRLLAGARPRSSHTGLPDDLKAGVESLSGLSLADVTVHYNSSQPAQLNALAYAQGRDIYLAPGQEQHLPHEAWHVVQQAQGRVQATTQLKGRVPVNADAGLEREAEVMGERALASAAQVSRTPKDQGARPGASAQ